MKIVKDENEEVTNPDPCRMKNEDTEEQRGWCLYFIFLYWCLVRNSTKIVFLKSKSVIMYIGVYELF